MLPGSFISLLIYIYINSDKFFFKIRSHAKKAGGQRKNGRRLG